MKSPRMSTYRSPMVLTTLVLLLLVALPFGSAHAAPQYDVDCNGCHTMPPLDSDNGKRLPVSGAVKGNHATHADSTPSSCVKCHGPEVTATAHRDKTIQMASDINFQPAGGRYSRSVGVFVNQTTIPPLGSCSSVNCHFEAPTPAWGAAKYQVPAVDPNSCGGCHGSGANAAPADGNHPNSSFLKGQKHAAYYGTGADSCVYCHPNHAATGAPFAHATSARPGGRNIVVSFSAPNAGASYSNTPSLSFPNYLPSGTPAAMRNGTCSALYCHSNGAGTGPKKAAVWGDTLDCAGCHGFDAASGSNAMATDAHAAHVKNQAAVGFDMGCQECHSATTTNGTSVTSIANHVDKKVNVKFGSAVNRASDLPAYNGSPTDAPAGSVKDPQTAVGNCDNVYCHSSGNVDASGNLVSIQGEGFRSVAWNGGAMGCDGCHGDRNGKSHPVYQNVGAGVAGANTHVQHVEGKSYGCNYCHATTTLDGALSPTSVQPGGAHLNRIDDVNFMSYGSRTGSYDGGKTCSATYCHSSGEATPAAPLVPAQWGGAKLNCRGCHGGDAGHANPIASGRHAAHMNNANGNNFVCAECHAQTAGFGNNTTVIDKTRHVDAFRDYSGYRAGKMATYYAERTCGNLYCHSSGEKVPQFRNMTGSKSWGRSEKLSCNGCHGDATDPTLGTPEYASSGQRYNSHKKHTVDAGMADSTGCANCHRTTVDRLMPGKMRAYSSAHVNGVRDVSFAPLANITGAYLAGSRGCSNTYCHGKKVSPAWGDATPLSCTECHGADANLAGAHGSHWQTGVASSYTAAPGNGTGTAQYYKFECSSCHKGSHSTGPSPVRNNAAEVFFSYSGGGLRGEYSYGFNTWTDVSLQWSDGTCANTYCHSRADAGKREGIATGTMTWASAPGTLTCEGCHGGSADKGAGKVIDTGLHRNHIDPTANLSLGTGNGIKCAECHAKTVGTASDTVLVDKTKHVNKFKDYSGVRAGAYEKLAKDKKCSTVYCHSNGKSGSVQQYRDPAAWDASTSLSCDGCHGHAEGAQLDTALPADPATGWPNYVNTGAVGGKESNSHRLHVEKMGITSANQCYGCHTATMDKFATSKFRPYSSLHVNGVAEVRFGEINSPAFTWISSVKKARYNTSDRSCSTVACHSNGKGGYQDAKWGETSNCGMCHALNKLSRGHAFHIYTGATNNPTFYKNYTANRSNSLAAQGRYNYGCGNCHPLDNPNHMKGEVLIDLAGGNASTVGMLRSKNGAAINKGSVVAGTAGSGTSWEGNKLFCDNVYCHSNGYAADLRFVKTPDWFAGNFSNATDRCANCHGNSPNTDPVNMPGSASHYNQNWLGSQTEGGHYMGIHARTITNKGDALSQETFVGNLAPGSVEPASHGFAGSSTTVSCNTCHWDVIQTGANFAAAQCASCHSASAGRAEIANKKFHVDGNVKVSFLPTQVKSKAQLRDVSFATISGSTLWHRNGVYKSPTGFDSSKQVMGDVATWSNGNCNNVVCHFNKQVPWKVPTGTTVACESCHTSM